MMNIKQKVYIMNQGTFSMFGYVNLTLPAVVDLTPKQVEELKAAGYSVQNFTGVGRRDAVGDSIRTVSMRTLDQKRKRR